jgi:hypothetical protein
VELQIAKEGKPFQSVKKMLLGKTCNLLFMRPHKGVELGRKSGEGVDKKLQLYR